MKKKIRLTIQEQHTLLKLKSLLNCLWYLLKEGDKALADDLHRLCRKYCLLGK